MARTANGRDNTRARIDSRGRVSIPRVYRDSLGLDRGKKVVILKDFNREGCLVVYNFEKWKTIEANMERKLNPANKRQKKLYRWILSGMTITEVDDMGRILLPGGLMNYAHLKDEAYFQYFPGFLEIWNPERFESVGMGTDEEFPEEEIMEIFDGERGERHEGDTQTSNG